MSHVKLGSYAPTTQAVPIYAATPGANVVPNTVSMSLTPEVPEADMGKAKMGAGCRRRRMGRAGTRCFCNGKLVKTSRCK